MKSNIRVELGSAFVQQDGNRIGIEEALFAACVWVNSLRTTFRCNDEASKLMGGNWRTHPDQDVVKAWLRSRGGGDVAKEYDIMYFVAAHVISEWMAVPKRTVREHKKLFGDIEEGACRLADLLESTDDHYYRGGGHGLANARICELFDDREYVQTVEVLESTYAQNPIITDDGDRHVMPGDTHFPDLETVLRRIASAARRISKEGPMHSQPNKRGALTGYFVRRMGKLLTARYDESPPSVVAAIATMALNEPVDDDLARKHLGLAERSGRK